MMNPQLKRQLAELALAGTGHHYHQEAATIADWLAGAPDMTECVTLIRLSSLVNRGDYQGALLLGQESCTTDIEPWLALCEWRLGQQEALAARLLRLEQSDQPALQQFAVGLREQMIS
ncbi:YscG family type III secretion system chaperone AscG [Aeromonas salmonicida]|uniref:YscG family type III secretion system chaperone AscG n=1 Tax=Aeromonas salmonicida TaxID=645 RepID=UPI000BB53656|nr:YscG family type III secretion system chaperone AscG [Aeromonas salmonicida]ATD40610.1 type III secretion protein, YscG family [Aeromonas salmonicida subsp. masoucida]QOI95771.1 YscG family type III secretion system chaperone AscG [Aeromonas salmonicida subsp. masoucida]